MCVWCASCTYEDSRWGCWKRRFLSGLLTELSVPCWEEKQRLSVNPCLPLKQSPFGRKLADFFSHLSKSCALLLADPRDCRFSCLFSGLNNRGPTCQHMIAD